MFGVGLPVALQCRVTLLPSVMTVLEEELFIAAGTIWQQQTKQKIIVLKMIKFHLPLNEWMNEWMNKLVFKVSNSYDPSKICYEWPCLNGK